MRSTFIRMIVAVLSGCLITLAVPNVTLAQASLTTVGAERCGPGPVTLQAIASNNSIVHWYPSATDTIPIATGNTLVIPFLPQTTTYYAEATGTGRKAVVATVKPAPSVHLGNDTLICDNTSLLLNAGSDGSQYLWNTGETTQMITVTFAGTYTVTVTNSAGCSTKDTIAVKMSGHLPEFDGIWITNDGDNSFKFNAINPRYALGYIWDFGDGSPKSNEAKPRHAYFERGTKTYVVTLTALSNCGVKIDSTSAHILGVSDVKDNKAVSIYPNPATTQATIKTTGNVNLKNITVYNILGKKVINVQPEKSKQYTLNVRSLASGIYLVSIETDKGSAVKKLKVVR